MRREDYRIDIINLKNGVHDYDFSIDDTFFSFFDDSIVESGSLKATVNLEKNDRLIRCLFQIDGTIRLVCDRSVKEFDEEFNKSFEHLFKYSEIDMDDTEDITHIGSKTESIDLGQLIYEFIAVSIPMKKIHPDHRGDGNENDFFYISEGEEKKESDEETMDPRWEALKKLNKN